MYVCLPSGLELESGGCYKKITCSNGIDIDIFVNCNWVVTRWQLYNTHLHTNNTQNDTKQTIHSTTQNFENNTKILEECGPCPDLASYTLAFALQLRKKHGKPSVRIVEQ
jgi:hypothetical protein